MPAFRTSSADIVSELGGLPNGTPVSAVAGRLLDLFTGGLVEPGTRLPPERQLASNLGVGRSAVREALAALEILGIVHVRPGSGTYLAGRASDLLPETMRWGLLIGRKSTRELLEFRSGLEIYIARLAAARCDESSLRRVRQAMDGMRASLVDLEAFAAADSHFHEALATIADNTVLDGQLRVVRSLLQVYADRSVRDARDISRAVDEHEAVLKAVEAQDEDQAASAMAIHMATASRRLLGD